MPVKPAKPGYIMKPGDNFLKISKALYGDESAASAIIKANEGSVTRPLPGMAIRLPTTVPTTPVPGTTPTVSPVETSVFNSPTTIARQLLAQIGVSRQALGNGITGQPIAQRFESRPPITPLFTGAEGFMPGTIPMSIPQVETGPGVRPIGSVFDQATRASGESATSAITQPALSRFPGMRDTRDLLNTFDRDWNRVPYGPEPDNWVPVTPRPPTTPGTGGGDANGYLPGGGYGGGGGGGRWPGGGGGGGSTGRDVLSGLKNGSYRWRISTG